MLFLFMLCMNYKLGRIYNIKIFWGLGLSLEVNVFLRTIVIRADDVVFFFGLLVRYVYRVL